MSARDDSARTPEISVVISTLGMYPVLRRVLDGYSRQDAPPNSFEVVVVVDRADPRPDAVDEAIDARRYPVRRIVGHTAGLSANRNSGWRAAEAPVVLFTDNDTIPERRLVTEHIAWHRRYAAQEVGVLGHVRWARELKVTPFMRWLERGIQFDYPSIRGIEAGWGRFYGANASVKKDLVKRVGDFNEERLPYGYEDLDWSYRASKLGFRLLYNRRAVVQHLRPMTLEFWRKRVRRTAVAEREFVRLHPEIPPYFFNLFSAASEWPAPGTRARRFAPFVPRWVPLVGARVWRGADVTFFKALAPHFLAAWEEEAASPLDEPVQPELSELEESSLGSDP